MPQDLKDFLRCVTLLSLVAVSTLALQVTVDVPLALAATTCQNNNSDSFAGARNLFGQSNTGVGATITTQVPALCIGSDPSSDSSIWALVTGHGANDGYAQSGYIRQVGQSTVYYFAEYIKFDTDPKPTRVIGNAASGTHDYEELYDYVSAIHMYVDNSTLLTTNFDPTTVWAAPWDPEWQGETHDLGDDVAGTTSQPVYFTNMCLRTSRNQGCTTTPSNVTLHTDDTRYHYIWDTTNQAFHIWSTNS
jgi:hypothetical protein